MAKLGCFLFFLTCLFLGETVSLSLHQNATIQLKNLLKAANASNYSVDKNIFDHPDYHLTTIQLVNKYGYDGQMHQVTTHDGYILELHRVNTRGKNPDVHKWKQPVLILHGILCASSDFVLAGTERGLAYMLADAGYDVWLGNVRGNKYSRQHVYLNTDSRLFWDFSVHEIGLYDIPAMLEYILEISECRKLIYLAHSQGTAAFNIMASEAPENLRKIRTAIFLAPIGHLEYMSSPVFAALSYVTESISWLMELLGEYSLQPTGTLMKRFKSLLCSPLSITQAICTNLIFSICGYSPSQMDKKLLPLLMNHLPAGASMKQFRHFAQIYINGKFQKFDYGYFENLKRYGHSQPPMYNLTKVNVDVHLFYGNADWIATPKDTARLHRELPKSTIYRVPWINFNHLDFLWGVDVKELLYEKILRVMAHYPPHKK